MKRGLKRSIWAFLLAGLCQPVFAVCDSSLAPTATTRSGLIVPQTNSCGWGAVINANWSILDSSMCLLSAANTFTSSQTFVSNIEVNGKSVYLGSAAGTAIQLQSKTSVLSSCLINGSVSGGCNNTAPQLIISTWSAGANAQLFLDATGRLSVGNQLGPNQLNVNGSAFVGSFATLDTGFPALGKSRFQVVASSLDTYAFSISTSNLAGYKFTISTFGAVVISSNTTLPGATFYPNAPVVFSTSIAFTPGAVGIIGETDNTDPIPSVVGYYLSTTTPAIPVGVAGNYFDVISTGIPAGDWFLTAFIEIDGNGATFTSSDLEIGISQTAGNTGAGLSAGVNWSYQKLPFTGQENIALMIPRWRLKTTAATTIVYLKMVVGSYTVATPTVAGNLIINRRR